MDVILECQTVPLLCSSVLDVFLLHSLHHTIANPIIYRIWIFHTSLFLPPCFHTLATSMFTFCCLQTGGTTASIKNQTNDHNPSLTPTHNLDP